MWPRLWFAVAATAGLSIAQQPNRDLLLNPDAPEFTAPAPAQCVVRLDTTHGVIDIEVTRAWAPLGADRFVNLVKYGYYDDNPFFRMVKDRWVQWGINPNPPIAKTWRSRTLPDDPFQPAHSNIHGTVAFAFAVPNGRTTQVYISLQDNSATHDREPFVPFGRVIAGLDVADTLYSEYGDNSGGGIRAGRQDAMFNEGNAFFAKFPKLDRIKRAFMK